MDAGTRVPRRRRAVAVDRNDPDVIVSHEGEDSLDRPGGNLVV
jgi:hypothetical protein